MAGGAGGLGHRPSLCTKYRNPRVSGETIKSPFFSFFALPTPADEADVQGKAFVPRLPEKRRGLNLKQLWSKQAFMKPLETPSGKGETIVTTIITRSIGNLSRF